MNVTDTYSLLAPARGGDARARGELFESLRARLVLWCATRMSAGLRAKVEPEDVAQEILVVLLRDLPTYAGRDRRSFYAWVFRVAEHRLLDLVDHFSAAKRQPAELPRSWQTTPCTASVRNETLLRLAQAVETLPEDHRRVVQLRKLEEREFAEIASTLGRSENAVRILYCRALKSLRASLGESG